MKILILGGTVFLGRHLVEAALENGHEVTLFNRGQTNAHLYPDVEKIKGDRDGGLDGLKGRKWDAVLDPSGFVPRLVRDSAQLLRDAVEHYVFISSISVYSDVSQPIDEDSPVGTLEDETVEEISGPTYGPLKALCEQAVEAIMPGRTASLRAGLIVGKYDSNNRFPYWIKRIAQGGEVLAPDNPALTTQIIDARDIANWALHLAEQKTGGIFNTTGPEQLTIGTALDTIKSVVGSDAEFTWVDEAFLLENEVAPLNEMPLWMPKDASAILNVDIRRAVAAGLTFRPLEETVRDTWAWLQEDGGNIPPPKRGTIQIAAGMQPEREKQLLEAWHSR